MRYTWDKSMLLQPVLESNLASSFDDMSLTDGGSETPASGLLNGWAGRFTYVKHLNGFVEYEGQVVVGNTAMFTPIFQFPEGCRPFDDNHMIVFYEILDDYNYHLVYARVYQDGFVKLLNDILPGTTLYFAGAYPTIQ